MLVRRWLDTWNGTEAVIVGTIRQGYDVSMTSGENGEAFSPNGCGWRATFLHRSHVYRPWVGQVRSWWTMPWRAVQEAAWRALNTPLVTDYSVTEESPP